MGRSRGVPNSADVDAHQRSKKRRAASSGENFETMATVLPGTTEGKKVLYHCNYCNKDITGKIRIKCTECTDFDLCLECYSVGAEVTPHKSNHTYRVMDSLSFPLICPDWNADEEILLLEGIEMYGLGNWPEIAEHVGTKSKVQCIDHYTTSYINSPCYPLPDMSRVNGKNRKELLAMAKVQDECKKDPQMERNVGVKNPMYSKDDGPSITELSGYNPRRQEFDPEYDNDAEQELAEMEFKESDSETERELKLRVLHIFLSRLNERKWRKDFILERNLLYPNSLEKELSSEDREVYQRYKVFARFQSQEEHEALVQSVLEERRIRRRIRELQECRAAGCHTLAEAKMHIEQKRKRESEAGAQKVGESSQVVASKVSAEANRTMNRDKGESDGSLQNTIQNHKMNGNAWLGTSDKDPSSMVTGQATARSFDEWDIAGLPASDLLSETEKHLCCQNRLLPSQYLKIQEVLMREIFKGTILKNSDAHNFFNIDPSKVDAIYNIVMKKVVPT